MLTDNKKIYVAQENNSSVKETEYSDMCEQKLYAFEWEFYTNVSIIVFRIYYETMNGRSATISEATLCNKNYNVVS